VREARRRRRPLRNRLNFSLSQVVSVVISRGSFLFFTISEFEIYFEAFTFVFLDAFSHLYKRVCPSVRRSVRRSVRPSVRPSVRRSVTHELKSCKSTVFDQNYWQYERGRILCRVYGLVLSSISIIELILEIILRVFIYWRSFTLFFT